MDMLKSSKKHVRTYFQILEEKWGLSFAYVHSFFISFIYSPNMAPKGCHYRILSVSWESPPVITTTVFQLFT